MLVNREVYTNGNVTTETYDDGVSGSQTLAAYRYDKEVGGVSYLGKTIQTDKETRANWIGILINAQANPSYTTPWKTSDGSFVTYDSTQAIGAALAASEHVQKCFAAEQIVSENLGNYTTAEQIKTAFNTAYGGL